MDNESIVAMGEVADKTRMTWVMLKGGMVDTESTVAMDEVAGETRMTWVRMKGGMVYNESIVAIGRGLGMGPEDQREQGRGCGWDIGVAVYSHYCG